MDQKINLRLKSTTFLEKNIQHYKTLAHTGNKGKTQIEFIELRHFCSANTQQTEEATRMEENIC